MKNSFNFKNVVVLAAASLFIFTLFFNVSLVQNDGDGFSVSLASLQTAQAQDGEHEGPCIPSSICNPKWTCRIDSNGNRVCSSEPVCKEVSNCY